MTSTDSPTVLSELDEHGVLLLTLNRPERNNGWTIEMEEAYFGALIAAANDPTVRVIVVTGAGRAFCPGLDMIALAESAATGKRIGSRRYPMDLARRVHKPIIAAINGAAAGIGFIQACCADIRFAASTAKFTSSFARRGLPAEHGITWVVERIVGYANAADLMLSARVVMADEALAMGLVNRVLPPDELLPAALAYARDVAHNCAPISLAHIKSQLLDDLERSSDEARLQGLVLMADHSGTADFNEGVKSFQERRPPNFSGYDAELRVMRGV
ncbi:MAG: enoyl-CoA hydratase-related protein [Actinomycetota bacterium]|nr:enoyl-CoA hydratase-related protein [Actinomycetota bacterium]